MMITNTASFLPSPSNVNDEPDNVMSAVEKRYTPIYTLHICYIHTQYNIDDRQAGRQAGRHQHVDSINTYTATTGQDRTGQDSNSDVM
jgi:hypothetical protein